MAAEQDSSGGGADDDGGGDVVDFNALHAALGDLPPPSSSAPVLGAVTSDGKNNATYASARPHTIPPTRAPAVDPNAPSIVVAEDALPPASVPNIPLNAAAQMTIPMGSPILSGVAAMSPGPMPVAGHGFDPRYPAQENVQQTMHMAGRPVAVAPIPRRPRTPTMVVRPRGPSGKKKAFVFIAMLLLVVGVGVGLIAVLQPAGLSLDSILGKSPSTAPRK
jgi:hypothetical protein